MTRHLRSLCIRLWITLFLGIPLSLVTGSAFLSFSSGPGLFIVEAGVVILLFFFIDAVFHILGQTMITRLIKEGEAWERSGIFIKSRKCYESAVRIFDTFLLSPFRSKRTALMLTRTLAQFALSSQAGLPQFSLAVNAYLEMNPLDEDICLLWVKRLIKCEQITPEQEAILTLLASVHGDSPRLMPLLTRCFIGLGRTDFAAQTIYQRAVADQSLNRRFADRIRDLMVNPDDSNGAMEPAPARRDYSVDTGTAPAYRPHIGGAGRTGRKLAGSVISAVRSIVRTTGSLLAAMISFVALTAGAAVTCVKEKEKVRFYLKLAAVTLAGIFLVLFIMNTISHLVPEKVPASDPVPVDIQTPKPFTIQVAAYLTQRHAQNYVARLKKQDIDARIKTVDGGGKQWFLVMVSEFPDKASAAEYGRTLKQRGLIQDFFVNNR